MIFETNWDGLAVIEPGREAAEARGHEHQAGDMYDDDGQWIGNDSFESEEAAAYAMYEDQEAAHLYAEDEAAAYLEDESWTSADAAYVDAFDM